MNTSKRTAYIINVLGLPGSGKTTFAKMLVKRLGAAHINADWARGTVTRHLGFSLEDRIEQARVLGALSAHAAETSLWVVTDFVNPTKETREAFMEGVYKNNRISLFTVWMSTLSTGRFQDTNELFEPVQRYVSHRDHWTVRGWHTEEQLEQLADELVRTLHERAGVRSFHIDRNRDRDQHNWLVTDLGSGETTSVSCFELKGRVSATVNVGRHRHSAIIASGIPSWAHDSEGRQTFTLEC